MGAFWLRRVKKCERFKCRLVCYPTKIRNKQATSINGNFNFIRGGQFARVRAAA